MNAKLTVLSFVLLFGSVTNAQKQTIWVTAVPHNSNLISATATYQTPGYSSANCNGTATTNGNVTYGNANCNGTYTAPQQHNITISRLDVADKVRAQNGQIYTIVCSAHWVGSNCSPLIDGDTFSAEIDGSTMWIRAHKGGNQGKAVNVKYKILDIRQGPPVSMGFQQGVVGSAHAVGATSTPSSSQSIRNDVVPSASAPPIRSDDKGTVTVFSIPSGNEVYVDSVFVGDTPAKLRLTPGQHFVRVFADGYKNWSRNITVISDSEIELTANLDKAN
jgi:hypothetical protein